MKNTKKITIISLIALLVFLSASVTLRTVALFTSFNRATMHFDNSVTFTLSAIFAITAVLLFAADIFMFPKDYKLASDASSVAAFVPSGILSVSLLYMAVTMIFDTKGVGGTGGTVISSVIAFLPFILATLAILAAAFFFLGIMNAKKISNAKAALGLCTVAFLVLYGAYLYFNRNIHPTNSPNKIIDQMAYFFTAVFFLFETRIALGRDKWNLYVPFGLMAALLCGYSSIPALILYVANGSVISASITESVLTFTLFIYLSYKLLITLKLPNDNLCKMASAIQKMATAREEELAQKRIAAHARDYNIMEENSESEADDELSQQTAELTEGQISFELDGSEG